MVIFAVIAAYTLFILADFIPVIRKVKPGVAWSCAALFALGAAIQLLHEFGINVPSPSPQIVEFFTGWFDIG